MRHEPHRNPAPTRFGVAKRIWNRRLLAESRSATMEIHVFANNQQMGPYPKDTVIQMAGLGSLPADASVWHDRAGEWYPLSEFLAKNGGAAVAAPAAAAGPERQEREVVQVSMRDEGPSPTAYVVRGVAAGFGTAVVAGGIWLAFSIWTGIWLGLIGLLVGWLVGTATSVASREEGAAILPISAVVFTLMTCAPVLIARPLSPWVWLGSAFACFNAWKAAAN